MGKHGLDRVPVLKFTREPAIRPISILIERSGQSAIYVKIAGGELQGISSNDLCRNDIQSESFLNGAIKHMIDVNSSP